MTCGRLKVPENPANPAGGLVVEIAFMVVKAPKSTDQHGPVVFLNGGPGQNSLYYAEQLVSHPHIRDVVVDRDWVFFDQRGTGRSTPVGTLAGMTPQQQAEYLTHFRADAIVADAEHIRRVLGAERWSVLGQSFGGYPTLAYLSTAPDGLREAFFTGGLPPIGRRYPTAVCTLDGRHCAPPLTVGTCSSLRTSAIAWRPSMR